MMDKNIVHFDARADSTCWLAIQFPATEAESFP